MNLTRREFLIAGAAALAELTLGCTTPNPGKNQGPTSPRVAGPEAPTPVALPANESKTSLPRKDGSLISVTIQNKYPRPVTINPVTFGEIIRMSEDDIKHGFPDFTLKLENQLTGTRMNAVNSRLWEIEGDRFAKFSTTVMINLGSFAAVLPFSLFTIKEVGRNGVGPTVAENLAYIPDALIRQHTTQDLANAHLTAVLAEELVEANWSAQYLETHTTDEYQRDFPTLDVKEEVTDRYSLPFKKRVFEQVLGGKLKPAFIFPGSNLATQAEVINAIRAMGATEAQAKNTLSKWSSKLKQEGIH